MQSRPSSDLIKLSIALVDLGLITLAFFAAYWLRRDSLTDIKSYIWLYYFSAPLIIFLLLRYGVLTGYRFRTQAEIIFSSVRALIVAGIVSSAVLFLSKSGFFSRMLFGYYFVLSCLFILVEKVVLKYVFELHVKRGRMNIRIAMVGFGPKFNQLAAEIKDHQEWGLRPVLVIDPQQTDIASVAGKIRHAVVDEVYVCYPRGEVYHKQIDDLLDSLEKLGVPVRVALNFDELQKYYGQHACLLGTKEGVLLAPYNLDPDQRIIKRAMDVVGGMIGLVGTALFIPFLALAIKLESPGPIFFFQNRVGKGGRDFTLFKFRSMYADAEARKKDFMEQNIHQGALFKMENDPRITKVGHFIRKYSLDELPQFWNVLKGDMSLVGTRPPTRDEVEQYEDHHFRRISIKPGLTGLWQVSGRNDITDFDEIVALDVAYIKEWRIWLDIKIILRTARVVLFPNKSGGM